VPNADFGVGIETTTGTALVVFTISTPTIAM